MKIIGQPDISNPAHEDINSYAVSCSLSRKAPMPAEDLRRFAHKLMKTLSAACRAKGAKDIGHIKAYIEHAGGFLTVDIVGDPAAAVVVEGRDGDLAGHFRLVLNAVAFGISKSDLKAATDEALADVISAFALVRVVVEAKTEETLNANKGGP